MHREMVGPAAGDHQSTNDCSATYDEAQGDQASDYHYLDFNGHSMRPPQLIDGVRRVIE
jgi:hypothetical protein